MAIHFKELAQLGAIVAAAESVGAERGIAPRNVLANLISVIAHVVGGGDDGTGMPLEGRLQVALAPRLGQMQQVVALCAHAVAAQLVEARHAPDIARSSPLVAEQIA